MVKTACGSPLTSAIANTPWGLDPSWEGYIELFAVEKAWEQLEEGLALAEDLHSPIWRHLIIGSFAGLHLLMNEPEQAQACLEQVTLSGMDPGAKRYCWLRRAELALATDDPALALDITDRLIASTPSMAPGRVITYLWKLKADALVAMKPTETARVETAHSLLLAAIDNAQASGERFLMWRLQASLGRLYRILGDRVGAERAFSAARALIDELAGTITDKTLKEVFRQGAYGHL